MLKKVKNVPGGLPDSHISSHASDLAGDPLHAGLALEDGVVDVVDALNHVVHWVHFCTREKGNLLDVGLV